MNAPVGLYDRLAHTTSLKVSQRLLLSLSSCSPCEDRRRQVQALGVDFRYHGVAQVDHISLLGVHSHPF